MAAAEARAGWQRTANRYFAQEDARRAPKISCGPSSSSSKFQADAGPGDEANVSNFPNTGYIPHNRNRDLPPDTKWWLHLQPNFVHQRDFTYEQLSSLEAELEVISAEYADQYVKTNKHHEPINDNGCQINMQHNADLFPDQPWKVSAACFKNDQDPTMPELKAVLGNNPKTTLKNTDMGEFWYGDDNLMDWDPLNCSFSKQPNKFSSDLDSQWMGAQKNEPWWRTADKDELASLVAQKSLDHIENCDLPRPQAKHFRNGPSASLECFGRDGILSSSLDRTSEMGLSSLTKCIHESPSSVSMNKKHCTLGDVERSPLGSDQTFSDNEHTNKAEMQNASENNPSKAQLLEALCHSQTRAREAEKAAQEAYTEKEHIIKLVFKQASQLFAYKQWFHLLQLENLCLQLKNNNKDGPVSTLFPLVFPWTPHKGSQLKKGRHKGTKKKSKPRMYDISKSVVAFAIGLGLAGAGLLLGWTMGWLFPAL